MTERVESLDVSTPSSGEIRAAMLVFVLTLCVIVVDLIRAMNAAARALRQRRETKRREFIAAVQKMKATRGVLGKFNIKNKNKVAPTPSSSSSSSSSSSTSSTPSLGGPGPEPELEPSSDASESTTNTKTDELDDHEMNGLLSGHVHAAPPVFLTRVKDWLFILDLASYFLPLFTLGMWYYLKYVIVPNLRMQLRWDVIQYPGVVGTGPLSLPPTVIRGRLQLVVCFKGTSHNQCRLTVYTTSTLQFKAASPKSSSE